MEAPNQAPGSNLVAIDREFAERIVDIVGGMKALYAQKDRGDWFDVDDIAIETCYDIAALFSEKLQIGGSRQNEEPTVRDVLGYGFRALELGDCSNTLGDYLDRCGDLTGAAPFSELRDILLADGIPLSELSGWPTAATTVRNYCLAEYDDPAVENIDPGLTLGALASLVDSGGDVSSVIGTDDIGVREGALGGIAKLMDLDWNDVCCIADHRPEFPSRLIPHSRTWDCLAGMGYTGYVWKVSVLRSNSDGSWEFADAPSFEAMFLTRDQAEKHARSFGNDDAKAFRSHDCQDVGVEVTAYSWMNGEEVDVGECVMSADFYADGRVIRWREPRGLVRRTPHPRCQLA